MKPAQKWDFYKKEYKKTEVADECSTFENAEKPTVECASCGKSIKQRARLSAFNIGLLIHYLDFWFVPSATKMK